MAKRKTKLPGQGRGGQLVEMTNRAVAMHAQEKDEAKKAKKKAEEKAKYWERQAGKAQREVRKLRHPDSNPQAFYEFAEKAWAIITKRGASKLTSWPVFYIWLRDNDKGLPPANIANVFINALHNGDKGLEKYKERAAQSVVAIQQETAEDETALEDVESTPLPESEAEHA